MLHLTSGVFNKENWCVSLEVGMTLHGLAAGSDLHSKCCIVMSCITGVSKRY